VPGFLVVALINDPQQQLDFRRKHGGSFTVVPDGSHPRLTIRESYQQVGKSTSVFRVHRLVRGGSRAQGPGYWHVSSHRVTEETKCWIRADEYNLEGYRVLFDAVESRG
jgi:hypothetical protein